MFVSVGTAIQVAYGIGMKFSAVDAAFSKHTIYHDGYFHLLTTRDGNNRVLPLAWALCETESGDTYEWFAEKCIEGCRIGSSIIWCKLKDLFCTMYRPGGPFIY